MTIDQLKLRFYGALTGFILVLFGFQYAYGIKIEENRKRINQEMIEFRAKKDAELKRRLKELDEKYAEEDKKWKDRYNISALAVNAYYESRGVGGKNFKLKGKDMENITQVVLNRWKSGKYGETIDDVLYQYKWIGDKKVCQFSWACQEDLPQINYDSKEYKLAYKIAANLYYGRKKNRVTAFHYYNPKIAKPIWAKKMKEVAYVISGHRIVN